MSIRLAVALVLALSAVCPHNTLAKELSFDELPQDAKNILAEVRSTCKGGGGAQSADPRAGTQFFYAGKNQELFLLLDAKQACSVQVKAGGACATGGCNVNIYRRLENQTWVKEFSELLMEARVEYPKGTDHFAEVVISIWGRGGTTNCSDKKGASCIYTLNWDDSQFIWKRVH